LNLICSGVSPKQRIFECLDITSISMSAGGGLKTRAEKCFLANALRANVPCKELLRDLKEPSMIHATPTLPLRLHMANTPSMLCLYSPAAVGAVSNEVMTDDPDQYISTSYVERQNLPLRTTPAKVVGVADRAWTIGQLFGAALAVARRHPETPPNRRRAFTVIQGGKVSGGRSGQGDG
jgi:hypothetical protein